METTAWGSGSPYSRERPATHPATQGCKVGEHSSRAKGDPAQAQEVTLFLSKPGPGRGVSLLSPRGERRSSGGLLAWAQTHRTASGNRAPRQDGDREITTWPLPLPLAGAPVPGGQEAHPAPPMAQPPAHLPRQTSTPGTSLELRRCWVGKLRPPPWGYY